MAEQPNITDSEEWRDAPGFEGRYQVSSKGRVASIFANRKILKPWVDRGYAIVRLRKHGRLTRIGVHRLVCMAWHGPAPSTDHCAAHNDGVSLNNVPNNVRWATHAENMADKIIHRKPYQICATRRGRRKDERLTEEQVSFIQERLDLSIRDVARMLGFSPTHIRRIRRAGAPESL